MSVVNTMLRELAERQQRDSEPDNVTALPLSAQTVATEPPRRWPWWFFAMLIMAGGIVLWRWSHAVAPEPFVAPNMPTASPPSFAASTAPLPAATAVASQPESTPVTQHEGGMSASAQPASIGWELVQAPDTFAELDAIDPMDQADSNPAVTEPSTTTATAAATSSAPAAGPVIFERQPTQLSIAEQVAHWRDEARNALASGDPRGANQAINLGLQLQADDAELRELQLRTLATSAPLAAQQQAEQLLLQQPQQWRARLWLGSQYLHQQQAERARELLRNEAPALTAEPDYHAVLALAEQQSGDHVAAIARYRQLQQQQPQFGRHAAGLALSLEATGDMGNALLAWQQALADPALPVAVNRFGLLRVQQLRHTTSTQTMGSALP